MERNTRTSRPFNSRGSQERGGPRGQRDAASPRPRFRKKIAKFNMPKDSNIEYKNLPLLQRYVTERGKIVPRRISGVTSKEQRHLCIAIKRARYLGLLPVGSSKKI